MVGSLGEVEERVGGAVFSVIGGEDTHKKPSVDSNRFQRPPPFMRMADARLCRMSGVCGAPFDEVAD